VVVPKPIPDADDAEEIARRLLGLKLRALRAERGLTLWDVAEASGVTEGYLSHVERGTRLPSLSVLVSLGKTYDLLVTEMLTGVYPFGTRGTRRAKGRKPM
jgi:transcriptional regulator with XRE-family HTH domain